jgi:large subunit ribosomal protein L23
MAILTGKKNTTKKVAKAEVKEVPKKAATTSRVSYVPHLVKDVIVRPRITEKATLLSERHVYAFDVAIGATKNDITHAIKGLYKVTPVDVRLVPVPSKKIFSKGKPGRSPKGKKAYVELKKGDKIELA